MGPLRTALSAKITKEFAGATPGPFGPIIDALLQLLMSWLGGCSLSHATQARAFVAPSFGVFMLLNAIEDTHGTDGHELDILRAVQNVRKNTSRADALALVVEKP